METTLYNQEGKKAGNISLPEKVFSRAWNSDLVHQVLVSMQANARTSTAHTKNRGEVSGGGKKPWKQKGTGRARHGSSRSPIWVGGGVAHGPRAEKVYTKKINRKMKAQALFAVLSRKYKDGEILFVDSVSTGGFSAKNAKNIVKTLSSIKGFEQMDTRTKGSLFAFSTPTLEVKKSFSNFGNITLDDARNLNVVDLLNHKFLVLAPAEEAVAFLSGKTTGAKKVQSKKIKEEGEVEKAPRVKAVKKAPVNKPVKKKTTKK